MNLKSRMLEKLQSFLNHSSSGMSRRASGENQTYKAVAEDILSLRSNGYTGDSSMSIQFDEMEEFFPQCVVEGTFYNWEFLDFLEGSDVQILFEHPEHAAAIVYKTPNSANIPNQKDCFAYEVKGKAIFLKDLIEKFNLEGEELNKDDYFMIFRKPYIESIKEYKA